MANPGQKTGFPKHLHDQSSGPPAHLPAKKPKSGPEQSPVCLAQGRGGRAVLSGETGRDTSSLSMKPDSGPQTRLHSLWARRHRSPHFGLKQAPGIGRLSACVLDAPLCDRNISPRLYGGVQPLRQEQDSPNINKWDSVCHRTFNPDLMICKS